MVKEKKVHQCLACGYITQYSTNMYNHVKRLKPCVASFDDPLLMQMRELYCCTKCEKKDERQREQTKIVCDLCLKEFSFPSSKSRHKVRCKGPGVLATINTTLNNNLQELRKELKELCESQQPSITNNITQHIQNNMNINVFGKETIDHIPAFCLDWCTKVGKKGHLQLIKTIYGSSQNKTVKSCNRPNRYLVNNGETFEYMINSDVQDIMIDRSHNILKNHFREREYEITTGMSDTTRRDIMQYLETLCQRDENKMQTLQWLKVSIDRMISDVASR